MLNKLHSILKDPDCAGNIRCFTRAFVCVMVYFSVFLYGVQEVGFCLADDGYGASPDGLVGDDGLIEIKCPTIAVHVGYLLAGMLPSDYFQQTQGQLLVTGRKWVDFFSYYPGLHPLLVRVGRDEGFIRRLKVELEIFCQELRETINKIK